MGRKRSEIEGRVCPAEAARFARVADEIMRTPFGTVRKPQEDQEGPFIGTLREKRMHAMIKRFICPDTAFHEIPVQETRRPPEETPPDGEGKPPKTRHMVADILKDGEIVEVQTGGFFPLKEKIAWYLTHTDCRVTVVHPMASTRYLSWIQPADGSIMSRRCSPKHERVKDIAKELYWLADFIGDPRVSVRLLFVDMEEFRMADGWSRDGKRGSNRYERFPTALCGDVTLQTAADYAHYFLPPALRVSVDGLSKPFTAGDYARETKIRNKATYTMVHLLTALGVLEEADRIGRSQGFRAARWVCVEDP